MWQSTHKQQVYIGECDRAHTSSRYILVNVTEHTQAAGLCWWLRPSIHKQQVCTGDCDRAGRYWWLWQSRSVLVIVTEQVGTGDCDRAPTRRRAAVGDCDASYFLCKNKINARNCRRDSLVCGFSWRFAAWTHNSLLDFDCHWWSPSQFMCYSLTSRCHWWSPS